MTRAIDKVVHCEHMQEVRRAINALDEVLVPLLVERVGYMTQAARIKPLAAQVRDESRIEAIVQRVRAQTLVEGGNADVMERIYRSLMEACIAFEHEEFARLRSGASDQPGAAA